MSAITNANSAATGKKPSAQWQYFRGKANSTRQEKALSLPDRSKFRPRGPDKDRTRLRPSFRRQGHQVRRRAVERRGAEVPSVRRRRRARPRRLCKISIRRHQLDSPATGHARRPEINSLDSNEADSRRYGQVSISIYAFMASSKRGAFSGLGNVQKVRDGERTGGNHASTEADFNGLGTPSGGFSTVKKGEQK